MAGVGPSMAGIWPSKPYVFEGPDSKGEWKKTSMESRSQSGDRSIFLGRLFGDLQVDPAVAMDHIRKISEWSSCETPSGARAKH